MAAPDFTTDIGKVRLLISDVDPIIGARTFSDDEIQAFLDLEGDIRLAAASALETLASNEVLLYKKVRAGRLIETDAPAVAAALMQRAQALRDQSNEDGAFAIADGGPCFAELAEIPSRDWGIF